MKPTVPLKLSAVAFTVLWTGWMVLLSDEPGTLVVTAFCGSVAGWLWYRVMCWCFRLMRLLPAARSQRGIELPDRRCLLAFHTIPGSMIDRTGSATRECPRN